jgi:hypothetical protein
MTLLISYRHDGFRFDTRKLYFSLDRAKVTSVSVRGEIEANPPLRLTDSLGLGEFSGQIAIFLHLLKQWLEAIEF